MRGKYPEVTDPHPRPSDGGSRLVQTASVPLVPLPGVAGLRVRLGLGRMAARDGPLAYGLGVELQP
jgi:hypothetical protein